jgi:dienelactone hydrolase
MAGASSLRTSSTVSPDAVYKEPAPIRRCLGRLNFILDIYRALEFLAKHPRVDTQRLALMGFSRGGQATLYASVKRFHKLWNKSGVDFAAYLPFYPDCATTYVEDTALSSSPVARLWRRSRRLQPTRKVQSIC